MYGLAANFAWVAQSPQSPAVEALWRGAAVRHRKAWMPTDGTIAQCGMAIKTNDTQLSVATVETYSVDVGPQRIAISAVTVYGAIRAIETLAQLSVRGAFQDVVIADSPTFQHRGLMLDTARHWFPTDTLKRLIDAMCMNKLNVLHLHLTDDQSFPVMSARFPNLTDTAWGKNERYSHQDLLDVVAHARGCGIRVVPEFDMPGHSLSWQSYPGLLTPGVNCSGIGRACLLPSPSTFAFIEAFLTEMSTIFTDDVIHLGGDEVFQPCWMSSPEVRSLYPNATSFAQILQQWYLQIRAIGIRLGKKLMFWEEMFENGAVMDPETTVIETWKSLSAPNITDAGLPVLNSYKLYLNHWCDLNGDGQPEDFYRVNVTAGVSNPTMVIGGEAAMWTVCVDENNVESTIWPRVAAMAEMLWNQQPEFPADRLDAQRCRMIGQGVRVTPFQWGPLCE